MNLLLDTHVVLWWYTNPKLLNDPVREAIEDAENEIFISAVVLWECSIKGSVGKLTLPDVVFNRAAIDFSELPITAKHAQRISHLPAIHNDPFDRLLIAQAQVEHLTLATRDKNILRYPDVKLLQA